MWQLGLAVLFLVAVSTLVWKLRRTRPYLATGWLWYLGTLVPVIGLIQVGDQAMADRYAYIPVIGIFVMIVWGAAVAADRRQLNLQLRAAVAICDSDGVVISDLAPDRLLAERLRSVVAYGQGYEI